MDDFYVRKLLEFVFIKKFRITPEITASDSSFPACLQTTDFPRKLHHILFVRRLFMHLKLRFEFENFARDMVHSHHTYITSILCSCLKESYAHRNIFDAFICICGSAKYFSEEILRRTGVDLRALNFNVIMEIYDTLLKKIIRRRGGFTRLIEFINEHRYLTWDLDKICLSTTDNSVAYLDEDLPDKLEKELHKECVNTSSFNREISGYSMAMTDNVLADTSVELPTLPTEQELNERINAFVLQDQTETTDQKTHEANLNLKPIKVAWQKYLHLDLDSKTYKVLQQGEDVALYHNVIQKVRRHKALKTLDIVTSDDCNLQEVDEILKRLKNAFESLIEILEKPDKE